MIRAEQKIQLNTLDTSTSFNIQPGHVAITEQYMVGVLFHWTYCLSGEFIYQASPPRYISFPLKSCYSVKIQLGQGFITMMPPLGKCFFPRKTMYRQRTYCHSFWTDVKSKSLLCLYTFHTSTVDTESSVRQGHSKLYQQRLDLGNGTDSNQ